MNKYIFVFCVLLPVVCQGAITQQFQANTPEPLNYSSSTWADVNNDNFADLVTASDDFNDVNGNSSYGRVHCFDVKNNQVLWTYTPNPPSPVCSTPTVADLDGDGDVEIIFGVGFSSTSHPGRIYIINHLGNYVWHFITQDMNNNGVPDGVYATPAVGDLDRDGLLDFVVSGFDQRVYAFHYSTSSGNYENLFEFHMGDTTYSSAALANIDDDPLLEIMVGIPVHLEDTMANTDFEFDILYDGGMLLVLDPYKNLSGDLLVRMHPDFLNQPGNQNKPKTYTTQTIRSSPAVADINNDGYFEIVHTTSAYRGGFHSRCGPSAITPVPSPNVYAWTHDGNPAWASWPVLGPSPANACDSNTIEDSETSPAVGDIDLDGKLEIIVAQRDPNDGGAIGDAKVFVINGENGTFMSPYNLSPGVVLTDRLGIIADVGIRSSPVIMNIDGDANPEFLFGYRDDIMILNVNGYSTGNNSCFNQGGTADCIFAGGQITYQTPGLWDCDCDTRTEISMAHKTGSGGSSAGRNQVWDSGISGVPDCTKPPSSWPMFRQNKYHTGLYDIVAPASVTDLQANQVSDTSVELQWTCTGHNGLIGCAFSYDIRFSSGGAFNWNTADKLQNVPLPKRSGLVQTKLVTGLDPSFSYTFAMKVADEADNVSAMSNTATVSLLVPSVSFWGITLLMLLLTSFILIKQNNG